MTEERERLEKIATNSIYSKGIAKRVLEYSCQIFMRYLRPGSILELGPAEGIMTDILYPLFPENYTVVDGSSIFIEQIKKRHININAAVALFEEFEPKSLSFPQSFDNIILGHVLEHVVDPVEILKLCKKWLKDDGIIITAVPNKNSIHRQAGVEMGLLSKLDDFSEKDKLHGHRRVFGLNSLIKTFEHAWEGGVHIHAKGGYYLKPLSDAQVESQWSNSMIDAFLKLGERYPDIAADIYVIAGYK